MGELSVVGIDISKRIFHFWGVDSRGHRILKKSVYRESLMEFVAQLPRVVIVMEACGGAHHWGRRFQTLGFPVRLISPQYVKPYVKTNKSDWADAEAICEAAQRPSMRFVPVKRIEQQELQHMHRIREGLLKHATALGNAIRGMLLEYGIAIAKGKKALRELPARINNALELTPLIRELVTKQLEHYWETVENIEQFDARLARLAKAHPVCARLLTIPAVGPTIATAIMSAVSDPAAFKNGRAFAASLGIVPKQHSSGGKDKLLGISKRGDKYIRKLLIHGARSTLYRAHLKEDAMSRWATNLKNRKGWNRTAVAVANKTARVIWSILRFERDYDVSKAAALPAA